MPGFEIFGEEEKQEINDVINTGVLFRYGFDAQRKGVWKAKSFEAYLCNLLDARFSHLCSSGTTALITALASSGIGAGDRVIVPPFTFIATIEAVLSVGAIPVFADIDETLCLDPNLLHKALTDKTKAVIPVHMCGSMAQIDKIKEFCDKENLILIEDACQSIGASFNGKAIGTFGKAGVFSFDPVKTITCGEGGALITDDESVYLAAEAYSDHGHDHIGDDRGKESSLCLGTNYRISELNAAVGLAQLKKLDFILKTQRENKGYIKDALSIISNIRFRSVPDEKGDSATFLSLFAQDEASAVKITDNINKSGIGGAFYWYPNNWHYIKQWGRLKGFKSPNKLTSHPEKYPDYAALDLKVSDDIMKRTISIQIKLGWSKSELAEYADKLVKAIKAV
ncbi:MAG: DegT/DnrJ/EryC1/StrS family aminotransferase [Deltaproteobacteria bacterium]|nr:DegT/DnrJ/EryC1/StrS family aminotransferase [Deltaproteobacteria bacterium]